MKIVKAIVDTHLVLSIRDIGPSCASKLKLEFTRSNPKFYKLRTMGFKAWKEKPKIESFEQEGNWLMLPRGALDQVREIAGMYELALEVDDQTLLLPPEDFELRKPLHPYQEVAVQAIVDHGGNCIIRGPCGSGKTVVLLGAIAALKQPTIVVVHTKALADQWKAKCAEFLGFVPGSVGGGERRLIRPITIAVQQTVWKCDPSTPWIREFGCVVTDEAQHVAAATHLAVAKTFPARYRIGASADERRKDQLEFLIHETIGPVVHEITRDELQQLGRLLPVRMRFVPTEYFDPVYLECLEQGITPDWVSMVTRLTEDEERNRIIEREINAILEEDPDNRILVLCDRVEACREWASRLDSSVGLLIGGAANKAELSRTIAGLNTGRVRVGIGTTVADEGLDVPSLSHVVITCPVHTNPKRLVQMVGRAARVCEGKEFATVGYLWDREMFPSPYAKEGPNADDVSLLPEADLERRRKAFVRRLAGSLGAEWSVADV